MKRNRHTNHPAAAVAKQKKAKLVTGDPEFKAAENEVKIWRLAAKG